MPVPRRRPGRLHHVRPRRFMAIKDENILLTCPADGQLPVDHGHEMGLFHHDCRFLSGYELRLDDGRPQAIEQAAETRSEALIRLAPAAAGGGPAGASAVRWHRRVDGGARVLTDTIRVENRSHREVELGLRLRFAAGFEDVFTLRGRRSARGTLRRPRLEQNALVLGYRGRDGIERETRISISLPVEWSIGRGTAASTARTALRLPPLDGATLEVSCAISERRASDRGEGPTSPSRLRRPPPATRIETDSAVFNRILGRARDDLRMLRSEHDGHAFYSAGVPWFAALFGRDSLVAGLQVLPFEQAVPEGTLRLLAKYQGHAVDARHDEQPGKILHELRLGELAGTGRIPHGPLYASIDATPLFLILLGQVVAWTGDLRLFEELREPFDLALGWIERFGDRDGDGYVEYLREARAGPANQGWKDSWDAIVDHRGRLARPPIALAEAQAYVYRAWVEAAGLLALAGDSSAAARLRQRAVALQDRFERDFWLPEASLYALGLDRAKHPLRVATSNPGHVLWAGLASEAHAPLVARRLLERDLFSGWGLRTLSSREARYDPLGYHLGTVWPHDTAFAIAGLRRYGLDKPAERLAGGLLDAAGRFPQARMPEAFSGAERRSDRVPRPYPEANRPQAWAAGAIVHVLQALLGLVADAPAARLRIVRPILPAGVDRLDLRALRVGDGAVDLHFERRGGRLAVDVSGSSDLRVEVADEWVDRQSLDAGHQPAG